MKQFRFDIVEYVATLSSYVVEAENEEEAEQKALIGDTVSEYPIRVLGVEDRQLY